jgi:monoamine oxidase
VPGPEVDVAIVGSGLAGLTAARTLAAAGARVRILEARDRIGGRTYTRPLGNASFDLGGQYVGAHHERMQTLAAEHGMELAPTPHSGKKWIEVGGRRRTFGGAIPPLPPIALVQLQLAIASLDRAARKIPYGEPWSASSAARWDAHTLESWWARLPFAGSTRALLRLTVRMTFGAEADEMSLLSLLQYAGSHRGLTYLMGIEGASQDKYFAEGAGELAKRLAAPLADRISLSSPVRGIAHGGAGVTLTSDTGSCRARRAIVALPPLLAGRIAYDPLLPGERTTLTDRFPMGAAVKVLALYERAFWRERGFSGEVVSDRGPLGIVFDTSKGGGRQPALVGFIEGTHARAWSARSPDERRKATLAQLAECFGPEAETPIEVVEQDWTAEPWTGGCSSAFAPPGVLSRYGHTLRAPIGRIHWAGTETAREWFGAMEGAVESGERAAREVLAAEGYAAAS